MSERAGFLSALTSLSKASGPSDDLCGPFLTALPVNGAAVSTLGDPLGSATVCSSDARAARLDEIQIDLGEGPCWDALQSNSPVLRTDLQTTADAHWPVAAQALRETGLKAVFAFPLRYGRLGIGAVDLYSDHASGLSSDDVDDASALANIAARLVLQRALGRLDQDSPEPDDGLNRREVHQASGMVSAQLSIPVEDALLVIRGHAYAASRPVREVASDIVSRRLDLGE
ncbi:MAG: transcriptional regulator [Frondihabitans sp.]|nr:transcriptional regulator [Frondihabitans sp.]